MDQVKELEEAILRRANHLAEEYRQRAERSRDNILRDASERLRLREDREVLLAKSIAERTYRRRVQSNELKLQKEMDLLRWNLVQGVLDSLDEQLREFTKQEDQYLELLKAYLKAGAAEIERDELIAEVNAQDFRRLQPRWEEISRKAAPEKTIRLAEDPIETLGGVRLSSADRRIRVDHTFEGRRERLGHQLHQIIIERLLPSTTDNSVIYTG